MPTHVNIFAEECLKSMRIRTRKPKMNILLSIYEFRVCILNISRNVTYQSVESKSINSNMHASIDYNKNTFTFAPYFSFSRYFNSEIRFQSQISIDHTFTPYFWAFIHNATLSIIHSNSCTRILFKWHTYRQAQCWICFFKGKKGYTTKSICLYEERGEQFSVVSFRLNFCPISFFLIN